MVFIEGICEKNIGAKGFEYLADDFHTILEMANIKGNVRLFFGKNDEKPKKTSPKIAHRRTKAY